MATQTTEAPSTPDTEPRFSFGGCYEPHPGPCEGHVSTKTHIPCCPIHSIPLVADPDDPTTGVCETRVRTYNPNHVGGTHWVPGGCTTYSSKKFTWAPRLAYDYRDLPDSPLDVSRFEAFEQGRGRADDPDLVAAVSRQVESWENPLTIPEIQLVLRALAVVEGDTAQGIR